MTYCEKILVSVIVLTLNSEKFIDRCINALKNQTYKKIEIIIVDAGSNDSTEKIIEGYKNNLDITFISAPGTTMGEAKNIGIDHSKGLFIGFCDSDDFYHNNRIKVLVEALSEFDYIDAAFNKIAHFNSSNPSNFYYPRKQYDRTGSLAKVILNNQYININSLLIKKHINIRFSSGQAGRYGEDWQYIDLVLSGVHFKFIDQTLSYIEVRNDSHTGWAIQYLMKWHVINNILDNKYLFLKNGIKNSYFNIVINVHFIKLFISCLIVKNSQIALNQVYPGYSSTPFIIKLLKFLKFLESETLSKVMIRLWLLNRNIKFKKID